MIHDNIIHIIGHELNRSPLKDKPINYACCVLYYMYFYYILYVFYFFMESRLKYDLFKSVVV